MPTVGLSMIARNAERDLRACLESVSGLVSEVVIADTGSTDGTLAIAREFGAKVVSHLWNHHFAEARNASLAASTADWVLVLDADEELSEEARSAIPALIAPARNAGGFRLVLGNYMPQQQLYWHGMHSTALTHAPQRALTLGAKSCFDIPLCRLFQRRPGVMYESRIHETVERSVLAMGFGIHSTDLRIHHYGYLADRTGFLQKQERYRDILLHALRDNPNDANRWMDLGTTERVYFGRLDEALMCYQRAAALGFPHSDPWIGMAQVYLETQNPNQALDALVHLSDSGREGLQKLELRGDALHGAGRIKEARTEYARALKTVRIRPALRDPLLEARLESKLGYAEIRLGMRRAGMAKMRRALAAHPDQLDAHNRLVKAYVLLGDDAAAADAAETTLKYFLSDALMARAAALSLRVGRRERAEKILDAGIRLFPDHSPLRNMRASLTQPTYAIGEEQNSCLAS